MSTLPRAEALSAKLERHFGFKRFRAGQAEAAEALGMSVRSAHDLWAYARSWLRRKTKGD